MHYTSKVTEKGFKMAFMVNKLAMINFSEIIVEKNAKNHCEIQVRTILACTLYSIKSGNFKIKMLKMVIGLSACNLKVVGLNTSQCIY